MKDNYTKEEVLKLLEEQKRMCWNEAMKSYKEHGEVFGTEIRNTPLATGESNYVVIEKEDLIALAGAMHWSGMLTKEGQEHLLQQFGIDLNN